MIEAIPNISEGQRPEVIHTLVETIVSVDGVRLVDHSADPSHHRSVFTIVGNVKSIHEAILKLFQVSITHIDLREHHGEHPRVGAVDVVPLVPLGTTSIQTCVDLARALGTAVAENFNIPVFLYEEAASAPHRSRLEHIRQGGFEELGSKLSKPNWMPDYGPRHPHITAGISVIGARGPLVAFNVNLASHDLRAAKYIAKQIRESSGGLLHVKALGLRVSSPEHDGVQVSINLTNYRQTSLAKVVASVIRETTKIGINVTGTELVGLIPADAIDRQLHDLSAVCLIRPDQVLENRLAHH